MPFLKLVRIPMQFRRNPIILRFPAIITTLLVLEYQRAFRPSQGHQKHVSDALGHLKQYGGTLFGVNIPIIRNICPQNMPPKSQFWPINHQQWSLIADQDADSCNLSAYSGPPGPVWHPRAHKNQPLPVAGCHITNNIPKYDNFRPKSDICYYIITIYVQPDRHAG